MPQGICKNICKEYHTTKRYKDGAKYCRECATFINYEGKYCPCCSTCVRSKPRGSTYYRNLIMVRRNAQKSNKEI